MTPDTRRRSRPAGAARPCCRYRSPAEPRPAAQDLRPRQPRRARGPVSGRCLRMPTSTSITGTSGLLPPAQIAGRRDRKHRAMTPYDWLACGHRLRVSRIALGLTQAEVANACGVSVRTYQRYETGHRQRGSGIVDFAFAHNVCLNWLIGGETAGVSKALTKGKVAILPAIGPKRRATLARNREWLGSGESAA
jgi:DNA-binding XRE family transcriptional regulator